MRPRIHPLCLLPALLLASMPSSSFELPEAMRQAISWLPPDTETVIVRVGPFDVDVQARDEATFEQAWTGLAMNLLMARHRELLEGLRISGVVEGARSFRSPKSLGFMPFEGATILLLQDGGSPKVQSYLQQLRGCTEREAIGSLEVYRYEEVWEMDTWKISVARPRADVLVAASSDSYLNQVVQRMRGCSDNGILSWPGWAHVLPESSVMAVRRYEAAEDAFEDPSSPLGSELARDGEPDADARGLAFSTRAGSCTGVVRYLSTGRAALAAMRRLWTQPEDGLLPAIEQVDDGVVEIRTDVPIVPRQDFYPPLSAQMIVTSSSCPTG